MFKNFIKYDGTDEAKAKVSGLVERLNDKYKGDMVYGVKFIEDSTHSNSIWLTSEPANNIGLGTGCIGRINDYVCFDLREGNGYLRDKKHLNVISQDYYKELMEDAKDI